MLLGTDYSQLACTGYSICQYGQVSQGGGRHLIANRLGGKANPVISQQYSYAALPLLFAALILTKLSIGLSYIRIFYTDKQGRILMQITMGILVLSNLINMFEVMFACKPVHVYWTELRPVSKCLTTQIPLYVNGTVNVLVDIALIAIILPRVLSLKMNDRQKWALVAIVSVGWIAVAAGVLRMVRVGLTLGKPGGVVDPPWDTYDISIWTSTELYVCLICAAAPGVKPLVSKLLPRILGSTIKSRSRTRTWTTGAQPGSIELSSKMKKGPVGSVTVHRSTSETKLTGPYTEVGRGADADSLDGKITERGESPDGQIYKTSEITVQNSPAHAR